MVGLLGYVVAAWSLAMGRVDSQKSSGAVSTLRLQRTCGTPLLDSRSQRVSARHHRTDNERAMYVPECGWVGESLRPARKLGELFLVYQFQLSGSFCLDYL